jgi:Ion transport protein
LFTPVHPIRKFFITIEHYQVKNINLLNAMIYVAIGVSSLLPAFQSPLYDENSTDQMVIDRIDLSMTILFTIEIIVKVISNGLLFNGPKSYLRSPSNVIDFLVVVISLASTFVTATNLGMVKVLRIATRLTRPMRIILRDERLKISLKVL